MNRRRRRTLRDAGSILSVGTLTLAGCTRFNDGDSERGGTSESPAQSDGISTETRESTEGGTPTETQLEFDQREFDQLYERWRREVLARVDGFQLVGQMKQDEEIRIPAGKGLLYPDLGAEFDKGKMKDAKTVEDTVLWPHTAASYQLQERTNSSAISTHNHAMVHIVDLAVDQIADFDIEAPGYVDTKAYGDGSPHGLCYFAVSDDWFHMDTTSNEIVQLNEKEDREKSDFYPGNLRAGPANGVYDPVMRFEAGDSDLTNLNFEIFSSENATDYELVKGSALQMLFSTAKPVRYFEGNENAWGSSITLEQVRKHMWNGGDPAALVNPAQKAVYRQAKKPDQYVGVYGDTVDEMVVAVGGPDVYRRAMVEEAPVPMEWFEENTTPIPSYQ